MVVVAEMVEGEVCVGHHNVKWGRFGGVHGKCGETQHRRNKKKR